MIIAGNRLGSEGRNLTDPGNIGLPCWDWDAEAEAEAAGPSSGFCTFGLTVRVLAFDSY